MTKKLRYEGVSRAQASMWRTMLGEFQHHGVYGHNSRGKRWYKRCFTKAQRRFARRLVTSGGER